MKKIYVSLVSLLLTLAMTLSPAFAAGSNVDAIKAAANKVTNYYKKNNTLYSSDQVIAVEALGLDASGKDFKLDPDYKKSLASLSTKDIGAFTKGIIALALLGEDPADYQKNNYVTTLEGLVNADGSIKDVTGPNQSVYALYALESVNSSKVSEVAKNLASQAMENGAFWYFYNGKFADDSTTAWVAEALSNADAKTYDGTIKKAFAYLKGGYKQDGSYDNSGFGGNADTQSCVLQAYAVYNKKAIKTKAVDYLLSKQLDDGSFSALSYTTGKEESNDYTTVEAARALGTYENGSIYAKASANYKQLTDQKAAAEKAKKEAEKAKKAAEQAKKDAAEKANKTLEKAKKDAEETVKKVSENTNDKKAVTASTLAKQTAAKKTKTSMKTLKSKNVKLSKTSYVYNAKTQKPTVKVTYNKKTLKKGKDYTLSYAKVSKKVGIYSVKVKGLGKYKGTITKKYNIVPKKVSVKKVKATKKGYTVTYKKATGAKKYQVAYQNNKGKWVYKTTSKLSYAVNTKKVKAIKVRAFVKVKVQTLYGAWSKKVSVKA